MFYDVLCDHDQKLPNKDFCPSVTSHSYLGTYVLTPYVCSDTSSRHWLTSTMFWHLVTSLTSTTLIVAWRRARRCSICIAPLYFILTTEFSQQTKRQNDKTIQCSYRSTVQICTVVLLYFIPTDKTKAVLGTSLRARIRIPQNAFLSVSFLIPALRIRLD